MARRVTVDTREARVAWHMRFRRADDFKPVFRWAHRELMRANAANFMSEGAASGRPWKALDGKYARWKLENFGPRPILILSGSLQSSLTNLRGYPNEIDKKSAVFGTDIPYAKYHQTGTSRMPQREVVYVPPLFAQAIGLRIANHIVYGKLGGVSASTSLLKGLF